MAWSYTRTITIDKTKVGGATHTDFPVLISTIDALLKTVANGGHVRNSSGYDIAFFSNAALTIPLKFEIEKYVATTGEYIAWVKIPSLSSSADTVIYIGYGDATISASQADPPNVWNTAFKTVLHMQTISGARVLDSTSNNNHPDLEAYDVVGPPSAIVPTIETDGGRVANGLDMEFITIYHSGAALGNANITLGSGDWTVEGWCNIKTSPGTDSNRAALFGIGRTPDVLGYVLSFDDTRHLQGAAQDDSFNSCAQIQDAAAMSLATWYHVAITFQSSTRTLRLYKNGVFINSSSAAAWAGGSKKLSLDRINTTANPGNLFLDEIRVSNAQRATQWLLGTYNSQASPSTFFALGAEVATGAGTVVRAKLEIELAGFGNGWTNITHDLMLEEDLEWGLPGVSPRDRVAHPGTLKFSLNNHESNLAHLRGNYSPDHANCRVGFAEGVRVRYSQVVGATTYTLHVGTLDDIVPDPDERGGTFLVHCTSVDFMDDIMRASCSGVSVLQNVRDDQIFSNLIASMSRQPQAIQVFNGPDTFAIALDKITNETSRMSVLHDVCLSSLSLCYDKAGTLVYEPRNVRAGSGSSIDTFTAKIAGLNLSRNRQNRINRVEVTAHPRLVDANPTTVLWALPTGNNISIPANTSVVYWTPYTDPNNPSVSIGGLSVQVPQRTTDFLFNSAADGSGTNLTPNVTATITAFGNTAQVTFTNTGASGFLTFARVLGKGVYDYAAALLQAEDTDSQVNVGLNLLSFDALYQTNIPTAYEIAVYLVNLYKGAATQVESVKFRCPATDTDLATRLLLRQISDKVSLAETLTGLSTSRAFFINAIKMRADDRHNLEVEWLLSPADQTAYWLLEVVGRSELNNTTRLGFGLVLGHTDVAHGDTHGDIAHSDVAHADTHTDDPHQDVAHGDGSTHGDLAHSDTAHTDTVHNDAAHGDTHGDVAHTDVAHVDSHSDVAHSDVAHSDVAHDDVVHSDEIVHSDHEDVGHSDDNVHFDSHTDVAHQDSHTDAAHADTHSDSAHSDVTHSDSHSDSAHGDTAHADTAHLDVAHSDATSHADSAAVNITHGDVAHVDTLHQDVTHTDTHTDAAHGDIN